MRALFVTLPLVMAACSNVPAAKAPPATGQSFPQALTMICDVDRLAGLEGDADPLGSGPKRSAWLAEHVDNPDAIELKTLMSVKGPADQARMLREHAKEAGVTRCALADALEHSTTGGLSP
ncbi:MAG: hypothetical protein QM820_18830 [Minicystis sp.]